MNLLLPAVGLVALVIAAMSSKKSSGGSAAPKQPVEPVEPVTPVKTTPSGGQTPLAGVASSPNHQWVFQIDPSTANPNGAAKVAVTVTGDASKGGDLTLANPGKFDYVYKAAGDFSTPGEHPPPTVLSGTDLGASYPITYYMYKTNEPGDPSADAQGFIYRQFKVSQGPAFMAGTTSIPPAPRLWTFVDKKPYTYSRQGTQFRNWVVGQTINLPKSWNKYIDQKGSYCPSSPDCTPAGWPPDTRTPPYMG